MAPVQGIQGEVEIIYQILGSDRQRMVSAAPHARTSFGVTGNGHAPIDTSAFSGAGLRRMWRSR